MGGPASGNGDEVLGNPFGAPWTDADDKPADVLAPLNADGDPALLRNDGDVPLANEEPLTPLQMPVPCLLPTSEPAPATDLE